MLHTAWRYSPAPLQRQTRGRCRRREAPARAGERRWRQRWVDTLATPRGFSGGLSQGTVDGLAILHDELSRSGIDGLSQGWAHEWLGLHLLGSEFQQAPVRSRAAC